MIPTVAIIMRAFNEMPHVQRTLAMLERQTFRDFELYAIDSGSSDGTLGALKAACPPDRLTTIARDDYIPGRVLNHAIARTQHDIIVLLNADAVPLTEDWLGNLIEPLRSGDADAAYSRQDARPDARFIVAYDYERAYSSDHPPEHFFSAAACAFRREMWNRFKFHEEGYAEDAIWAASCRQLNARFTLVPDSVVEHSHNYSLEALYQKRFRHGESFAQFQGETSPLGNRIYLCMREIVRDLIYTCRKKQFSTIPYNVAYRVTAHAAIHRGLRAGAR